MATDPLARVASARASLLAARLEFRAACVAARSAGATFTAIAAVAGVSKQAVRKLIERSES